MLDRHGIGVEWWAMRLRNSDLYGASRPQFVYKYSVRSSPSGLKSAKAPQW